MIRRMNVGNRIHFIPGIGVQVITPRAAAKWWLTGGISPSDCLYAYQPKGATSQAESYVNLNNPGVNNASVTVPPDWDATNGWKCNGSTQYVKTGAVIPDGGSFFIQYTNSYAGTTVYMFGCETGTGSLQSTLGCQNRYGEAIIFHAGDNDPFSGDITYPGMPNGNLAICAQKGYRNGVLAAPSITHTNPWPNNRTIWLGCLNDDNVAKNFCPIYVSAVVAYSNDQSGNAALIVAAMAAL